MPFIVGDRVREHKTCELGTVYKVFTVADNRPRVAVMMDSGRDASAMHPDNYDLIAPKSRIAVGDRVRHIFTGRTDTLWGVDVHTGEVRFALTGRVYTPSEFHRLFEKVAPKSKFDVGQLVRYNKGNTVYHVTGTDVNGFVSFEGRPFGLHESMLVKVADPKYYNPCAELPIPRGMCLETTGFDCSDTGNQHSPVGENKTKEDSSMPKKFNKGDRVYRLGDGWSKGKHGEEGTVLGTNASGSIIVQMDNGHKTPNGLSTAFALVTPKSSNKGTQMNKDFSVKIEEQTVVNGQVIKDTTPDNDLLSVISQAEAEIAKLDKMKTKPRVVTNRIAELEAGITAVVAILDARTPEASSDD